MARASITYDILANDKTKSALKGVEQGFKKVGSIGVAAFAGSTAALAALTAAGLKSADALGKTADKLGVMPQALQGVQRAAALTGVKLETANMALQRMVRRTAEAAQGTGEARNALKELNLDATVLAQLSADEQFAKIAGAMENVASQGDKVRLSMKLFDSEGVALVNTLALGEEGLKAISKEIDDYGIALTRVDIAKIEAANDSLFKAKEVVSGFGQQLAVQFSPLLEAASNQFLEMAKQAGGAGTVATQVFNSMITGAGFVADAINGISLVFQAIKVIAFNAVAGVVAVLAELESGVVGFVNLITGSEFKGAITGISEQLVSAAVNATEEFQAALLAPPPSEKIQAFVAPIIAAANEAAAAAVIGKPGEVDPTESPEVSQAQLVKDELLRIKNSEKKELLNIEKKADNALFGLKRAGYSAVAGLAKKALGDSKAAAIAGIAIDAAFAGSEILAQGSREAAAIKAGHALQASLVPDPTGATQAAILAKGTALAGAAIATSKTLAAKAFAIKLGTGSIGALSGGGGGGGGAPGSGGGFGGLDPISSADDDFITDRTTQPTNVISIDFTGGITDTNAVREFIENDFAEALRDGSGLDVQVVAV